MTDEQAGSGAERPAADDVAADMERRLEALDADVHDARRKADATEANPLTGIAGDPEAIGEGPLSAGATPAAAEHHREDTGDRDPR